MCSFSSALHGKQLKHMYKRVDDGEEVRAGGERRGREE